MILYPFFIRLLHRLRVGKQLRDASITGERSTIFRRLHAHKAGTPNMGGAMLVVIMLVMIGLSFVLQDR